MWLDEKMDGEPNEQREWPEWFKLLDEPILTTDVGVWYSYVVLPQPSGNRDHGC